MSPKTRTLAILSSVLLALALPVTGRAAEVEAGQAQRPGPSDLELRAVGDRPVTLRLVQGGETAGRIQLIEPDQIVLSTRPDGRIITVPRSSVVEVRLDNAAVAIPIAPGRYDDEPPAPPRSAGLRHLAVNLSAAPGFDLDLDYGIFHRFANVGIVLPLATNGQVIPFSLGLGVCIPVAPRSPGPTHRDGECPLRAPMERAHAVTTAAISRLTHTST